ncbi:MAG TPA: SDR family NAD(P)-dependent oxidoreductase, partial [Dehalococcoidia bacterium]|nr:SDR family NAD(P)-dependent oxidoreductase [Dehalococcoidia bacterium]
MSGRTTSGLKGAVAIVTGGGGGLGREICAVLAEEGARVAVADIDVGRAGDVANGLRDAGREAIEVPLDVSDEGSVNAAVQAVLERYGGLDILVNNAGIDVTAPIDILSVADWDRVLGVNLRGPFLLVRRAVEAMTLGGEG